MHVRMISAVLNVLCSHPMSQGVVFVSASLAAVQCIAVRCHTGKGRHPDCLSNVRQNSGPPYGSSPTTGGQSRAC